ncbi:hypothetical protein F5Y15DRAFT_382221 [Xylariaceae sp. FL0016]|nr:hypothetical protein F5Y15DRAFT_382221 [Xylariaceae sp. FL0016]
MKDFSKRAMELERCPRPPLDVPAHAILGSVRARRRQKAISDPPVSAPSGVGTAMPADTHLSSPPCRPLPPLPNRPSFLTQRGTIPAQATADTGRDAPSSFKTTDSSNLKTIQTGQKAAPFQKRPSTGTLLAPPNTNSKLPEPEEEFPRRIFPRAKARPDVAALWYETVQTAKQRPKFRPLSSEDGPSHASDADTGTHPTPAATRRERLKALFGRSAGKSQ